MVAIDDLISGAGDQLQAALQRSRRAFETHNLTSGESTEAAVRQFFREHYPEAVGVGHGKVMDRLGNTSSQLDIVLYDKARTPVLFADQEQGNRLFPAEGVIAAVEVKSSVTATDLRRAASNAKKLKTLTRDAYCDSALAPRGTHTLYGRSWSQTAPPLFLVLAFEGPTMETVVKSLQEAHEGTRPWERVDMACVMDRGVTLNVSQEGTYTMDPRPDTVLRGNKMEKTLLFTHIIMSNVVFQMYVPPINLYKYLPQDFSFGERSK